MYKSRQFQQSFYSFCHAVLWPRQRSLWISLIVLFMDSLTSFLLLMSLAGPGKHSFNPFIVQSSLHHGEYAYFWSIFGLRIFPLWQGSCRAAKVGRSFILIKAGGRRGGGPRLHNVYLARLAALPPESRHGLLPLAAVDHLAPMHALGWSVGPFRDRP